MAWPFNQYISVQLDLSGCQAQLAIFPDTSPYIDEYPRRSTVLNNALIVQALTMISEPVHVKNQYWNAILANKYIEKLIYNKTYHVLSAQYIGTVVAHDNQVELSTFGTLYSYTIDVMFEELKNMRWTWHQGIGTTCMLIWYCLYHQEIDIDQIVATIGQHITLYCWVFKFLKVWYKLNDIHAIRKSDITFAQWCIQHFF